MLVYLIPKNIKVKREVFKGIGIIELIVISLSFGIGYLLSGIPCAHEIRIFLFFIFPLSSFLLILPLPNGSTTFKILKKFVIFKIKQNKYKIK